MVDKGSEFQNRSMKSFVQNNDIQMYLTLNEGKSVIAETFIRTLTIEVYRTWLQFQKMRILINLMKQMNKYSNILLSFILLI